MAHRRQPYGSDGSSRDSSPDRAHPPRRVPPMIPIQYGGAPAQHMPGRVLHLPGYGPPQLIRGGAFPPPRPAPNSHHHHHHAHTHHDHPHNHAHHDHHHHHAHHPHATYASSGSSDEGSSSDDGSLDGFVRGRGASNLEYAPPGPGRAIPMPGRRQPGVPMAYPSIPGGHMGHYPLRSPPRAGDAHGTGGRESDEGDSTESYETDSERDDANGRGPPRRGPHQHSHHCAEGACQRGGGRDRY
ncbi:hypothetical protein BZA05DRAFT_420893 [Tricharina praecox]|uniref:uncharacterized protein n=1 Tax=Tricharina praecox TaxID=43433 RepID=UPI0022211DE2|nr:uncharacterized protein BZA05DRAFT_420893 [Tricharina praecox]KAI5846714.1 hypothetical protein BZA05DRAFT_420893 [Tricharina praecox]